jgi:hypothetical protein
MQINGQIIAPSMEYSGGGVIVNPPVGLLNTGQRPYLAE